MRGLTWLLTCVSAATTSSATGVTAPTASMDRLPTSTPADPITNTGRAGTPDHAGAPGAARGARRAHYRAHGARLTGRFPNTF
jgi:hypothetical protein